MTTSPVSIDEPAWTTRFGPKERVLHAVLFTSFLGLTLTGVPLLFSGQGWGRGLGDFFGGYVVTGFLHRVFATALIGTFLFHVGELAYRIVIRRQVGLLWGPDSLVPQPRDVIQVAQHLRWFVGLGTRPRFDRFSYWEKFDYWAVFWGMVVIGFSGLLLWFPLLFATFLPGWMFNVAQVVHGEEALLAMVFIFTVHFFNGNLRPEKFPMDTVMFDGRESIETLQDERPAYYERLIAEDGLRGIVGDAPSRRLRRLGWLVGGVAMVTGLVTAGYIVYGLLIAGH